MNLKVKAFTDGEYNEDKLNTFLTEIGDRAVSVTPIPHKQTNAIMYSVVYKEEVVASLDGWSIGDKVRITKSTYGHEFGIDYEGFITAFYIDGRRTPFHIDNKWWISKTEAIKIS